MNDQRSSEQQIAMEEKIAYAEKLVSDLDAVVQHLNGRVHELERDMTNLRRQYEQHLLDLHEPDITEGGPTVQ